MATIENQEERLLPEPDSISQPFWDGSIVTV